MPVLRRIDDFLDASMPAAVRDRERRGANVLVIDRMIGAAQRFKIDRVRQEDLARAGGPPDEE